MIINDPVQELRQSTVTLLNYVTGIYYIAGQHACLFARDQSLLWARVICQRPVLVHIACCACLGEWKVEEASQNSLDGDLGLVLKVKKRMASLILRVQLNRDL